MQKIPGEQVFKCRICLKTYKSKRNLNKHQDTHNASIPRVIECTICKRTFCRITVRNAHVKNVHQKLKNHCCVFCEKRFATKGDLNIHIMNHIGEKRFWCNMCDCEFSRKDTLQMHQKQHKEKQSYKENRCEICSKSFYDKGNLIRHLQTHNPSRPRPYWCTICNKCFTTSACLEEHSLVVHQKIKKYSCVFCEKPFGRLGDLNDHIIGHVGEKHFWCKTCDKELSASRALKNHKMLHAKRKLFKCSQCFKACTTLASLKIHRLSHEPKSFQCVICLQMFARNKYLEWHILKHVKEKPCFCSECDEEFKLPKALTLHLKRGQCSKKKPTSSKSYSSKAKKIGKWAA
ncbi:unnamed protein product [Orchesella dallaii]|uniref:C2H2-type domain-containing protein n=1 Tax=Orchesella dallaii TaxID=48710 RepID=A0ABP1QYH7_9HEXA